MEYMREFWGYIPGVYTVIERYLCHFIVLCVMYTRLIILKYYYTFTNTHNIIILKEKKKAAAINPLTEALHKLKHKKGHM